MQGEFFAFPDARRPTEGTSTAIKEHLQLPPRVLSNVALGNLIATVTIPSKQMASSCVSILILWVMERNLCI